ncbi:MAG: response regulator transcription factor [Bacillota bacterium]|nr:response regulator transcription factor [Bacillota bacterium]
MKVDRLESEGRHVAARGESARGPRAIKVLVADSSAIFRSGMRRAIEAEPDLEVVGEADDLEQVAEMAANYRPDVIVAGEISPSALPPWRALPAAWASEPGAAAALSAAAPRAGAAAGRRIGDGDGATAGGEAGRPGKAGNAGATPHRRCALVAVVDVRDGGREVLDALMDAFGSGVLGCLDRSAGPEDLVYAVRAACRGRQFASSRVVRVLVEGLARLREVASGFEEAVVHAVSGPAGTASSGRAPAGDPKRLLTVRECEVLSLVARGKSNREIAGMLSISEKTVKNHVSNLLRKLGADRRTQAAIWAISQGLSGSQDGVTTTKVPPQNEPSD